MEVQKNKVVGIDYKLTDDSGKMIDSSEEHGLLFYIQGTGSLIPGLELALLGKKAGDHLSITIAAKDAYGEIDEALCQIVPKSQFESTEAVEIGMQFEVETEQGDIVVSVTKIEGEEVTVDGNHPLAGMNLHFDVSIKEVREATAEELSHGHVHDEHSHHH